VSLALSATAYGATLANYVEVIDLVKVLLNSITVCVPNHHKTDLFW
jgi:hypothetical protein